jgi:hypothetical protein
MICASLPNGEMIDRERELARLERQRDQRELDRWLDLADRMAREHEEALAELAKAVTVS